jgi:hypothetical protein
VRGAGSGGGGGELTPGWPPPVRPWLSAWGWPAPPAPRLSLSPWAPSRSGWVSSSSSWRGASPPRLGPGEPAEGGTPLCCARGTEGITVQYLGVGGWLFRFGGDALLTAPFFSNPSLLDVGVGGIAPDTATIDRFLPPVGDVSALLMGHGHYDHLMDVPYILRRHAPEAQLFGSATATNLVAGDLEIPGSAARSSGRNGRRP